jgi:DNA primase
MGMKVSDFWSAPVIGPRIEWSEVRDRVDLAAVATNLLGPAAKRQGRRLLWPCPFHQDRHPSLEVDPTRKTWRCWVCAIGGDAAELVKRVNICDFPAAVKFLADLSGVIPFSQARPSRSAPIAAPVRAPARPPEQPTDLPLDEASALVEEAKKTLWGPGGGNALAYLRGRRLSDGTIRQAGLGYTPSVMIPTKDGDRCFRFSGITIPWRDGARLTRIKIRRIDDGKPKYAEAYSDHPLIFPDPAVIIPGKPLIICEGEFDCLLLAQQLPEASVITLGSATARTDPAALSLMLRAPRWFVALDADQAGDSAARKFPARAIRVRPPEPYKDWGEVHAGGVNRIRYIWGRYLSMSETWEHLEPQRWGPALIEAADDEEASNS